MKPNPHIIERLLGIQQMLMGAHRAGAPMSAASRGTERQAFVDGFLSAILPPPYRFGTGDATDCNGNRSGQLDVVVEFPFLPSIPIQQGSSRLYLAEGIAAVTEVKSDAAGQWGEALETANKLATLSRENFALMYRGHVPPPSRIPLFVAGYRGWKTIDKLIERIGDGPVDGILIIDTPTLFVSSPALGCITCTGACALWGFVSCLSNLTLQVGASSFDPLDYVLDKSSAPDEPPAAL